MSVLTNKPTLDANAKLALSPPLRKSTATPVFKPDFARSLRMHPVLAAVVAAVVFAMLVGYALSLKPTYEAESLVYLEPAASKVLDDGTGGTFDSTRYDSYVQQQVQTASRLDILTAAVRALPVGVWRGAGEPEQSAAERLQHSLKIERVLNSYQLSFTLHGPDPAHTAQTLNAVVSAYLNAGRKDELTAADERAEILNEEKARIQTELASARAEQSSLSASLGMANPGLDSSNPYDAELSGLRTELAAAREAHDIAAAQLASVSGGGAQGSLGLSAAADELSAGDAGLSSMKATISQRRAVLSGQMAGLTPENPIFKQDAMELGNLDRSLEQMTSQVRDKAERRLQDKLRTDLARTGDVEARLNGQLARETGAATSASPRLQRASELTSDIQRLTKRYATVDDALRGLQLETSGPGTAHLALAAAAPGSPMPSRRRLLLLAAIPVALLCGAFAAVFARKRDPRVYTGRDIEDLLGFTPIAVLPAGDGIASGVMAEYVLRLAGGIEGAYRVSGARTFVLTPVGAGGEVEGLVEPLRGQLQQLGLLVKTVSAREVMTPAEEQGSEVRRREGVVAAHLETLLRRYDLLFIVAPALLTSAETEYLVRSADATILVADSGRTRRGELLQAALLLERLQVRGVGAVLAGLKLRDADAGFRHAIADGERREAAEARPWMRDAAVHEPMVASARPQQVDDSIAVEPAWRGATVPTAAVTVAAEQEPMVHAVERPAADVVAPVAREAGLGSAGEDKLPAEVTYQTARVAEEADSAMTRDAGSGASQHMEGAGAQERIETMDDPKEWRAGREDEAAAPPREQAEVAQEAPARVRTMHRSVPLRRAAEVREREGNWLKRLFVRDAEPVVSIIPDDDEDEEQATSEAEHGAVPSYAALQLEELDLPLASDRSVHPPHFAEGPGIGAPTEMAVAAPEPASPLPVALPHAVATAEVVEMPLAETGGPLPVEFAESLAAPESAPATAAAGSDADEDLFAPTQDATRAAIEASPESVPSQSLQPHVDAPLVTAGDGEHAGERHFASPSHESDPWVELARASAAGSASSALWARESLAFAQDFVSQPTEPVMEAEPVAEAEGATVKAAPMSTQAEPARDVASGPEPLLPAARRVREPVRAARWEAADLPSRVEVTPWRDRRISGPNSAYRAPERRFNWNTVDATPSGTWPVAPAKVAAENRLPVMPSSAAQAGAPERPVDRPRLVPAEPRPEGAGRLTRQWGLLSRFGGGDSPSGERDSGEFGDDPAARSQRGRRRG